MSRRPTSHRAPNLIAAAGGAMLATLGSSSADAGLMMDLRATGATTAGPGVVSPKDVVITAPGDTLTLGLFARVTGTDGVNNETFHSIYGLLNSVGLLKGDLSGGYGPSPFNTAGNQNGSVVDWDSDGDLDIGLSPTSSSSTGKFFSRSGSPTAMPSLGGDVLVGQFVWTVTDASFGWDFAINFTPRTNNGNNLAVTATWFEDANSVSKNPTNSPLTVGLPVTGIPEPSSLGLLSPGILGSLIRRRKRAQRSLS